MGMHGDQVTVDPNIIYGILLTETVWIDHYTTAKQCQLGKGNYKARPGGIKVA